MYVISEKTRELAKKYGYKYVGNGMFLASENVYTAFLKGLEDQRTNAKNGVVSPVKYNGSLLDQFPQ